MSSKERKQMFFGSYEKSDDPDEKFFETSEPSHQFIGEWVNMHPASISARKLLTAKILQNGRVFSHVLVEIGAG